jgi:hypothetical protein
MTGSTGLLDIYVTPQHEVPFVVSIVPAWAMNDPSVGLKEQTIVL